MGVEVGVPGGWMREMDMKALLLATFGCASFQQLAAWTMPKQKPEASASASGVGGGGSAGASASGSGGKGRVAKQPRDEGGKGVERERLKKYKYGV